MVSVNIMPEYVAFISVDAPSQVAGVYGPRTFCCQAQISLSHGRIKRKNMIIPLRLKQFAIT